MIDCFIPDWAQAALLALMWLAGAMAGFAFARRNKIRGGRD